MMKRLFISFFVAFLIIGFFGWLYLTIFYYSVAYLGAFISAFSGIFYFAGIYTFDKSSSNISKTNPYGIINYLGLIIVLFSLYQNPEPVHYFAGAYAALNLVMWQKYLAWYSAFGERNLAIEIDKKLLSKGILHLNGSAVQVGSLLAKPSVWLFYRGNWCPFCVAQVKELVAHYQEIEALGYQINLVSNQNQEHTQSLGNSLNIHANFFVDENAEYSKALGLFDKGGLPLGLELLDYQSDVLYPAIIITDRNGIVRFFDVTDNYRDRPEAALILEELKRFKGVG
jgi:peroxiredoxin